MVEPLRKRDKDGKPYQRRPAVEKELQGLEKLELAEVVALAREGEQKGKPSVSSEALVHILRREVRGATTRSATLGPIDALASMLIARCERTLKRRLWLYDDLAREEIAEEVMKHAVNDIYEDGEKADYAEINFNHWLARNRSDAVRKHGRKSARIKPQGETREDPQALEPEIDEDAGEAGHGSTPEVLLSLKEARERGNLPSFTQHLDFSPDELHRIAEMARRANLPADVLYAFLAHHLGLKVESQDPDEHTLVKHFNKSEKTIRLWIKRAEKVFAELRKANNERGNDEGELGIGTARIPR